MANGKGGLADQTNSTTIYMIWYHISQVLKTYSMENGRGGEGLAGQTNSTTIYMIWYHTLFKFNIWFGSLPHMLLGAAYVVWFTSQSSSENWGSSAVIIPVDYLRCGVRFCQAKKVSWMRNHPRNIKSKLQE